MSPSGALNWEPVNPITIGMLAIDAGVDEQSAKRLVLIKHLYLAGQIGDRAWVEGQLRKLMEGHGPRPR